MIAANIPLAGLTEDTVREIYPLLVPKDWKCGATIFREGQSCSGLHIAIDGVVKLYTADASGREQIVHLLSQPGPLSLSPLVDGGAYPLSAQTVTSARTLFLSGDDFHRLFRARVDFAMSVARELACRIRATTSIMQTLGLKQVPARVAARIIENARAYGALESGQPFSMLLSQEEMARLLCTSRESVARAFGEMRRAGVIDQRGSIVTVVDANALMRCAESTSWPSHSRDLTTGGPIERIRNR